MCEPVSIGMAIVAVVGAVAGSHDQAKQEGKLIDNQRQQHHEILRANNWANADTAMAIQDSAESTRSQLTETDIERMGNMSMLSTAISESNMRGRSMDRLKQVQELNYSMQESDTILNYQRDYQNLLTNRMGEAENMKAQITGAAPIPRTSNLTHAVNITQAGANGASMGLSLRAGFDNARENSKAKGTQSGLPSKRS